MHVLGLYALPLLQMRASDTRLSSVTMLIHHAFGLGCSLAASIASPSSLLR